MTGTVLHTVTVQTTDGLKRVTFYFKCCVTKIHWILMDGLEAKKVRMLQ